MKKYKVIIDGIDTIEETIENLVYQGWEIKGFSHHQNQEGSYSFSILMEKEEGSDN